MPDFFRQKSQKISVNVAEKEIMVFKDTNFTPKCASAVMESNNDRTDGFSFDKDLINFPGSPKN